MNKGMFAPRGTSLSDTKPMQFDRRKITNGLAWAGAALIVAIPAADLIARQFSSEPVQQVAVVEQEAPTQPTALTERPATATPAPATNTSAPQPATQTPATTATNTNGDAVDSFLQSGRELPSYISGGSGSVAANPRPATPATTAAPATQPVRTAPTQTASVPPQQTQPAQPAATQPARPQITTPRAVTGFPTPASERPRIATAPVPVNPAPVVQPSAPPLIIDNPGPVVTAQDLEDWETGPLSDFLANRGGQGQAQPPANYDGNGFWLDQGPNSGRNNQFPQAYDDYYYPYGQ